MTQQQPSIGRMVHYTTIREKNGEKIPTVNAATITAVYEDGKVGLVVFPAIVREAVRDAGSGYALYLTEIEHTTEPAGTEEAFGKWSWPVFVPPK
jgi:hypothetical protein